MKQITKYIGMVAIMAMFALATVPGSIDEAAAHTKNTKVVLAEPEPDVDLRTIQISEPRPGSDESFTSARNQANSDSEAVSYRVVYTIQNFGTTDVQNVTISVESDTETVDATLFGNLDSRHSILTVFVKAIDPATIEAKIVGFKI
ncbi:MAG: hypothetical protein IIA83_06375 [Thaumarchaeota archaeon]|nr:hypothetical protein [Nitrososphaerota archaeon]